MRFQLLGPPSIAHGPETVVLKPSKPTSLLAALLLCPGGAVSTTCPVSAVWDEDPPATARAALPTGVLRLRKLFTKYGISTTTIEAVPGGYRTHNDAETLDLALFRAQASQAPAAKPAARPPASTPGPSRTAAAPGALPVPTARVARPAADSGWRGVPRKGSGRPGLAPVPGFAGREATATIGWPRRSTGGGRSRGCRGIRCPR